MSDTLADAQPTPGTSQGARDPNLGPIPPPTTELARPQPAISGPRRAPRPSGASGPAEPAIAQPTGATEVAAPEVRFEPGSGESAAARAFLLIGLLVAIGLLSLAALPPALGGKSGGLTATALGFRTEIAVGGATLLLFSAIGFFLTA